jgi:small subunit ribosomal protein S20
MPHTKSAKKRHAQSERRRLRNRMAIRALKTQIKKVQEVAKSGDAARLEAEARLAAKKFDEAAAKGIVHRNLAARKKSQLSHFLKAAAK